ncbi:glycosyltransferase [Heyndrickxia ginsengihumi]|uniref:glycosyltransferase n=1 Tax=Heyndrickxia ginsengihumi TaxID=363870 RepID=UPI0020401F99|nr:glycosyltransferase [Heyndrickxia ginsengihumi]MCM3023157.1 glycosyltransferase [Heyndrickxia ginsengihumi]
MGDSLVSVIIPVFNTELYLEECLNSIINQTYKNIEIIVINDGSTDNSLKLLEEYASKHSNIKVISQRNSGNSVARNKGIEESNGKYIYFLDSDDFLLPQAFENLIEKMEKYDLDLIRFSAEPFLDGIDININKKLYDFKEYFKNGRVYEKKEFLSKNLKAFSSSPCLFIVKKDILKDNKLQFKPGILHEDELFTLELFLNINYAMYDTNFYYRRRYRKDSIMTSKNMDKVKKSFDSYHIVAIEMNKLLDRYTSRAESKLIKRRILAVYNTLLNKKIDETYKKNSLSKIKGVSCKSRCYYFLKYRVKKILRRVVRK